MLSWSRLSGLAGRVVVMVTIVRIGRQRCCCGNGCVPVLTDIGPLLGGRIQSQLEKEVVPSLDTALRMAGGNTHLVTPHRRRNSHTSLIAQGLIDSLFFLHINLFPPLIISLLKVKVESAIKGNRN